MTTEDDFQRALDANPDDWQTRLVFADWLQEQGDPRAEGYRALATGRYVLCDRYSGKPLRYVPHQTSRIFRDDGTGATGRDYTIPVDWFEQLPGVTPDSKLGSAAFASRREAENAAALAFLKLPEPRRAELLAGRPAES